MNTNETRIVNHRDGTQTVYRRTRLSLAEVARRFAIWTRLVPVGTQDADGIEYAIERERRGTSNADGSPIYATRLRVRANGREATATKTRLGEYFHAYLDRLDERGVEFWNNESRPCKWILADVFAV
jgi:predicted pyridoxine 5'-phosphate oxidase superfamily flavin-nucleotide-binding protein